MIDHHQILLGLGSLGSMCGMKTLEKGGKKGRREVVKKGRIEGRRIIINEEVGANLELCKKQFHLVYQDPAKNPTVMKCIGRDGGWE